MGDTARKRKGRRDKCSGNSSWKYIKKKKAAGLDEISNETWIHRGRLEK